MDIRNLTLPKYIALNCLTLGIYGFLVSNEIGKEVNALCKDDKEQTKFGYPGAVLLRAIAPYFGGLYLNYWWYRQAERLRLNGNRYGLSVRESGTDIFLYRTLFQLFFLPFTLISFLLSLLIPGLICLLFSKISIIALIVMICIFSIPFLIFGSELTAGSYFSFYFILKNLKRFQDVSRNGVAPFDSMAYEYYPSVENKYTNFLPGFVNGKNAPKDEPVDEIYEEPVTGPLNTGSLIGVKGSCAGYNFELISGEEIIIGKDAKVSMVVIDPAYKEISRKHVGVCYDVVRDQYRVVDYSSNGTWVNGRKMVTGQEEYLPHGTELKLANDKNIFRLG